MKKTEKTKDDWQRTISITKDSAELIDTIRKGVYGSTGEVLKTSTIVEVALRDLDRSLQNKAKKAPVDTTHVIMNTEDLNKLLGLIK